MRKNYAFFLLLLALKAVCQVNIVPNPGFELYSSCPTGGAQWNLCTGWNNVNMTIGAGLWGTPDYFNTCGTGGTAPPSTFAGTCVPQAGNAMMALVLYDVPYTDYREYLSTQLSCAMTPGNTYTVSFWITNGTGIKSPWTIKNIGVNFSAAPLTQSGYGVINVIPQYEITSNVVASNWVQYSFTINPTTSWNYITIGSFRTDANNNPTQSFPNPGGNASVYSNYYFDEIKVMAPTSLPSLTCSPANSSICVGQSVTLTASGATTYSWSNGINGSSTVVSPTVTTTYTVTGTASGGCSAGTSSTVATITVSQNPLLTVAGAATICSGQSATLTASGAPNYSWSTGATSSVLVVTPSVTSFYTVTGSNQVCSAQTVVSVYVATLQPPFVSAGSATHICLGHSATLIASGASSYSWNNNATTPTIVVTPTITTIYTVTNTGPCGGKAVITVSVSICENGISEVNGKGTFKLYPNPFKDEITIKAGGDINSLSILNALGQEVFAIDKPLDAPDKKITDLGFLPAGVYFVKLQLADGSRTLKIIKQ